MRVAAVALFFCLLAKMSMLMAESKAGWIKTKILSAAVEGFLVMQPGHQLMAQAEEPSAAS